MHIKNLQPGSLTPKKKVRRGIPKTHRQLPSWMPVGTCERGRGCCRDCSLSRDESLTLHSYMQLLSIFLKKNREMTLQEKEDAEEGPYEIMDYGKYNL